MADITLEQILQAQGLEGTPEEIASYTEVLKSQGLENLNQSELREQLLKSESIKRTADKVVEAELSKKLNLAQQVERTGGPDRVQASDMEHPFAGAYPGDTGSDNVKDYIIFKSFSNDVAGYTKATTIGGESQGDEATLEGTVQLYIPETLAVNSQVGYQNTSGGSLAGTFGNTFLGDGELSDNFSMNLFSQIIGQSLQQTGDTGGVVAQTGGLGVGAANRHVLFEGVDFRTFSYAYEFLPKSWAESVMLKKIIKFFRIQMLPEINPNGNTFKPPNYFIIEYMIDGKPTDYLNKIKPTVCTGCDVSYGGNGQFAMFQSDRGEEPAPALINLTLTFQEVQVVSKRDAAEGY